MACYLHVICMWIMLSFVQRTSVFDHTLLQLFFPKPTPWKLNDVANTGLLIMVSEMKNYFGSLALELFCSAHYCRIIKLNAAHSIASYGVSNHEV